MTATHSCSHNKNVIRRIILGSTLVIILTACGYKGPREAIVDESSGNITELDRTATVQACLIDLSCTPPSSLGIPSPTIELRGAYEVNIRAGRKGGEYLQKGDYKKAILFFEITAKTSKVNPFSFYNLYNLACTYSLDKQKKKALKSLKMAVEAGFKNRAHMEKDSDLLNIRNEKAFKEIMENLDSKN